MGWDVRAVSLQYGVERGSQVLLSIVVCWFACRLDLLQNYLVLLPLPPLLLSIVEHLVHLTSLLSSLILRCLSL